MVERTLCNVVKKKTSRAIFNDDIEEGVVFVEVEKLDDVDMDQISQNRSFSSDITLDIVRQRIRLRETYIEKRIKDGGKHRDVLKAEEG